MTQQTAAEALRALAHGTENRSKIGRLRGIYAEIEEAQRAGVSNSKIVETLNAQDYGLTLKTFETMLYRIRKERAQADAPASNTPTPVATQPTPKASDKVVAAETRSDLPQAGAGKTLTEQVMNTAPQKFSFKQQQKAKEQK